MTWTNEEIAAWLDERLPADRMAEFEQQLRQDDTLRDQVSAIIQQRDQGGHTVGEVWQRQRLSCPTRSELGGYLLDTLSPDAASYIDFHLTMVGCRICAANLDDLRERAESSESAPARRQRFFESSAGLLRSAGELDSSNDQF